MTKKQNQFSEYLIEWFKTHQRKLPWRETKNPYLIWVSEVMLQQTQVKKVLKHYQKFIDRFPNLRALAYADLQDVLKLWEGMGYYARARNLHRAVKIIVAEMDEKIPSDYERFRKLPGVGDYIAAAVLSLAFNAPHPVVDGNVKRVLARLFLIDLPINSSSAAKIFKQRITELLDAKQAGLFNQSMMELGAVICRPQNPNCNFCPVSDFCQAANTNQQHRFPVTIKRKSTPQYRITVGVINRNKRLLIVRRPSRGLLGGLWEFPGGKMQDGETPEQACVREVKEKTNIIVTIHDHFTQVKHAYTHFKIIMDVFYCKYLDGDVTLNGPDDYQWVTIQQLSQFPFHVANQKIITLLKKTTIP